MNTGDTQLKYAHKLKNLHIQSYHPLQVHRSPASLKNPLRLFSLTSGALFAILILFCLKFECKSWCWVKYSSAPILHDPYMWRIVLSTEFHVLGPFPQQAREQHFLSPSYPIDVSSLSFEVISQKQSFTTSFSDGGLVSWDRRQRDGKESTFRISYPNIRWSSIRATQGWAGLQHHSLLHATLTVLPPQPSSSNSTPRRICINVNGASYFAVQRRKSSSHNTIQWYPGNIYGLPGNCQLIPILPGDTIHSPMIFDLWISAGYEIRLFGDPLVGTGQQSPITVVEVHTSLELDENAVYLGDQHFFPDVVDGVLMGEAAGVELHSREGRWEIQRVACSEYGPLEVQLRTNPLYIAEGQTRRIPFILRQGSPIPSTTSHIELHLHLKRVGILPNRETKVTYRAQLRHIPALSSLPAEALKTLPPIKQTHWSPHVSISLLIPPLDIGATTLFQPILALHGAGVPLLGNAFWYSALPRQNLSWIVIPGGGSSWGYDWRGPSAQDSFAALNALRTRESTRVKMDPGFLVLGHSNGGQGTFYMASRYPDLANTAVPAAAYQSASLYVPNTWSHSAHFLDPALEAILRASLAGGDNDLFFGNLVRSRLRVIHGGDDSNVPVYHSRAALQVIKTWDPSADAQLFEVPHKDHWWDDVFTENSRASMISRLLYDRLDPQNQTDTFTLTVMWPQESGSMGGWRILQSLVPGRLSQVSVRHEFIIKTTNVLALSLAKTISIPEVIAIDSQLIKMPEGDLSENLVLRRNSSGTWNIISEPLKLGPSGPLSRVLVSSAPLLFVIPEGMAAWESAATRLAWAFYVYLGLDVQIQDDSEAWDAYHPDQSLEDSPLTRNALVFGGPESNKYAKELLLHSKSSFSFSDDGSFTLHGRTFSDPGIGLLFMHGNHLIFHANGPEDLAIERLLRAVPFRTGVPCPEWMIIGSRADSFGMGGILGAGFWGTDGFWSDGISWIS